ncbi:transaldolase [Parachitinimonas caeni]|uniref:Transaldolase n=1 Tax=Parachitinimonas caeni TaxID=3031301 RepID=A0ABT7DXR3_9NEIS|nr:transaldolase [Parachitinimonas caeni]MDK2124864.1 transaldolase [Parachitinimonas caeni]
MNPLLAVKPLGQRIWLDNLSRELLAGPLARLIEQDGLAGVTSNPAIFQKAIASGLGYADDLARLKAEALTPEQRFEALAVPDVQMACDLFAQSYQSSAGLDGYVSLEVSPHLARDTEGTLAAARRLWRDINRPNAMIKIPATPESLPAVTAAIADGININVTLIFSLPQLQAVFDAYTAGLMQRQTKGLPLQGIRAVASLFLSRVDTHVDRLLADLPGAAGLQGKAAIALAKTAYQTYLGHFEGSAFAGLQAAGAHGQRVLWASTGTKNPAYSDVMYVDELIGAETVNTLPDATLAAFRDHGRAEPRLTQNLPQAEQTLAELAALGIDLDAVGDTLQYEGLKLFDDAFASLLAQLS